MEAKGQEISKILKEVPKLYPKRYRVGKVSFPTFFRSRARKAFFTEINRAQLN